MSESEAKRLGMTIHETAGEVGTSTSRRSRLRVAVAKQLTSGGMRLKNVSFAVFRDDQEAGVRLPAGRRELAGHPRVARVATTAVSAGRHGGDWSAPRPAGCAQSQPVL